MKDRITRLVLGRKVKQTIWIDGKICIEINKVIGSHVQLAIMCPADMQILRGEVRELDLAAQEYARRVLE